MNGEDEGPLMRLPNRQTFKRICIFILAASLVFICALSAFFAYQLYLFTHADDFKTFEPRKLPLGLRVIDRELKIWHEHWLFEVDSPFYSDSDVLLNLNTSHGYILQKRISELRTDLSGCNIPWSIKCELRKTPGGQRYAISQIISYDRGYEASFYRDGTYVRVYLEKTINKVEWDEIVDSFVPMKFIDLRVRHFMYGL
jgi:hypothetical protein